MRKIELTKNQFALVDNSDFEWLNQWKWFYSSTGYATRSIKIKGQSKTIKMHRVINNTPNGFDTDHINRNKLDNRRINLRTATRSQNQHNSNLRIDNTSGVKGVSWDKQNNKWRAYIKIGGKQLYLGLFQNRVEAINKREGYYFG